MQNNYVLEYVSLIGNALFEFPSGCRSKAVSQQSVVGGAHCRRWYRCASFSEETAKLQTQRKPKKSCAQLEYL